MYEEITEKSSSAYLSFGHLIKKVIGFIFTVSMKSLESNHFFFPDVTDEWPSPRTQRNERQAHVSSRYTKAMVHFCLYM